MKTALQISGQIRNAAACYASIKQHIIDPYNADVFLDTWNPDGSEDCSVDQLINIYQPRAFFCENFDNSSLLDKIKKANLTNNTAYDGFSSDETKIQNVVCMLYKTWHANNLRKQYEVDTSIQYDCVIRMRFDIRFVKFPYIIPEANTVYIPAGNDHRGGICDHLFVSRSDVSDKTTNLYSCLNLYHAMGHGLHPESILRKHLEFHKIHVVRPEFEYYSDRFTHNSQSIDLRFMPFAYHK